MPEEETIPALPPSERPEDQWLRGEVLDYVELHERILPRLDGMLAEIWRLFDKRFPDARTMGGS